MTRASAALVLAATVAGAACGATEPARERIVVSAAASLTDAFADIAAAFEAAHPDVDVVLNFAGSSALRDQIVEGAPVDVLAAANVAIMDQVEAAGAVGSPPAVFAGNGLQIVVPAANPGEVTGLVDFADPALFLGLCAPAVPCGDLARQALSNAGVVPDVDTEEPDVRALLTKVAAGELDAGIVYVTDVVAGGGSVAGIDIPTDVNVVADYPIAALADAPNPDGAAAFVDFVLSAEGRAILERHGFVLP